ncbi:MAG: PqqD family protein [Anaerolineae bacterium]|nr:PqqD family protein [Anaerolineae bacterium]MCO5207974.1 PqqD family protein [Anaerolineae bacterium]
MTLDIDYPQRNPTVDVEDMGDEAVLVSADHAFVHTLSPTAYFIWQRCDGDHSVAQIEADLRAEWKVPDGVDVSADIRALLAELAAKNLLV